MKVSLNPETGLLPPGEHNMTLEQIDHLFGHTSHRRYLLEMLHKVCLILKTAGVPQIWINGSFVTSKHRPGDYDICYEITEDIFKALPDYPFKQERADTLIRGEFGGDVKAEPMDCGALYRRDLFPNVVGHVHNGKLIQGVKKGIVVLELARLPDHIKD